jgi:hypothetical protein
MLKNPDLFKNGFHLTYFPLSEEIKTLVLEKDWNHLDQKIKELTQKDGALFDFLKKYHDFEEIEFIISIRDSSNEWEEDGIWHDDGSRVFAFSLSLTINADDLVGGRLQVRPKNTDNSFEIPTPSFGGIILFLTGLYGFEHKINQVLKGQRVIIAGWCS